MPHVSGRSSSLGCVPAMNHSSTAFLSDFAIAGPRVDLDPDESLGRTLEVRLRPLRGRLVQEALPDVVETSIEKSGRSRVETRLLSELPFQTPTARAYAPVFASRSVGGAM